VDINILYIHGFGSRFDVNNEKVQELKNIGIVFGINIDYTKPFDYNMGAIMDVIIVEQIDMVVGTSMGGYMAAQSGSKCGVPFVAINPAVDPATTLQRYVGAGTDYSGKKYTLDKSTVSEYTSIDTDGCGLILLDMGDDVIDPIITNNKLQNHYKVVTFEGGTHRFDHISDSINFIEDHFHSCQLSNGLNSD
jgi:predicted esterase YcpF (UPF0227 family)